MNSRDKITMTVGELKHLVAESKRKLTEAKKDFGYVYLSELFHKQPANIPQRALRKIFKQFDNESDDLNNAVVEWMKEMINLPKNEWITPKDMGAFMGVVWDRNGSTRGYGVSPALKFKTYNAAENFAYLLSDYNNRTPGWGYTRSWIGRTYP